MLDDRFESDVRIALRLELESAHAGAAAPQIRGRIAERARSRRRRRLALVAAVAVVVVAGFAIPALGGLVLIEPVAPPPAGMQAAAVAAIDSPSGDLIVSWVSPNGQMLTAARYGGILGELRKATGDAAIRRLPAGAVATAGPDGRIAVALDRGDVVVARGPGRRPFLIRAIDPAQASTWLGWAPDGRLVIVAGALAGPDARLRLRLVDPETGEGISTALPYDVVPSASSEILTWTDDGRVLAWRSDPTTFGHVMGSLDVTTGQPSFEPGPPAKIRVATGLEPLIASDGSAPNGWSEDSLPGYPSIGLAAAADGAAPNERWYTPAAGERVFAVTRSASLDELVALVARGDASGGRVTVIDAPGSWRDALVLAGATADATPALGSGRSTFPRIDGVAPDGRSVAVHINDRLVVGDIVSGEWVDLPAGSVFAGWPGSTVVGVEAMPELPTCVPPSGATPMSIAMSTAGRIAPASGGVLPVVGERGDADPFRRSELEAANAVVTPAGGPLTLAMPSGICVTAVQADAVAARSPDGGAPVVLASRTAGSGTTTGLIDIPAPAPDGDWVVRVRLWLAGADREAILLYHVRTTAP